MLLNTTAAGMFSLYYISRHNELNRIKKLTLSIDMIVNVSVRALFAFGCADIATRKLFVNYDKITQHKVANNEIKKIMRSMPNARPYLMPHKKPNSYYWSM